MTRTIPPAVPSDEPAPSAPAAAADDEAALAALLDAFRNGRSPAARIAGRLRRVLAEGGDTPSPPPRPGGTRPS
ncbi:MULTISPECIES: hypothetical protein [Rubrivivax]|uniref:Uncharacterized protein n=1 Tax=Rubrivivax benzoatilyticus TaxID=316997 RepID=A0ABX0I2D4_9BURK|nr:MULTISPECIES: hypothetical protein [Rubrivivax]EGJ10895.1 hypothetical protein RBXJA2T_11236 [Rubrivivax benzoatilyticus JA2 = ATCC BAA-35]MCC9597035.1 hypothetical protein [Rubrivivax sp. JA1055]MCC9646706.1 hypothetical protein [Rubrivivax sp. JA1029]NHL00265.1 hypothetical protein [Rubrivivax benzoatilyticus]NHL26140.1 hypothetical protein [Rubrivivax benzoatilyticus]